MRLAYGCDQEGIQKVKVSFFSGAISLSSPPSVAKGRRRKGLSIFASSPLARKPPSTTPPSLLPNQGRRAKNRVSWSLFSKHDPAQNRSKKKSIIFALVARKTYAILKKIQRDNGQVRFHETPKPSSPFASPHLLLCLPLRSGAFGFHLPLPFLSLSTYSSLPPSEKGGFWLEAPWSLSLEVGGGIQRFNF